MSLEAIYKEDKSKQLLPSRCFETIFPHIKLITLVEKITYICIALILSRMNASSFTDDLHRLSEFCILIEWDANKLSRRQNFILF